MEKLRKDLSAPGLLGRVRGCFERIGDHRNGRCTISLPDALLSGLAVFGLKCSSLLQFDQQREDAHSRPQFANALRCEAGAL